ncbi:hypothetical protein FNV43_RR19058 [Rhamnella rubrinervis]|uniref:DUF1985 domain-containing protein n=1 Tax=Rhamnella rubrinervis TaxID=2594499 RepID=A0A8K0GTH6_9ROSA|nr:hypothetical protein FNV43_RR19058 [Rhamnella rubrinervis]
MFTGLNCGKFPKETRMRNLSYSLWTKYFGESGLMTQTEFGQAFKNIEFKYDNDQEIWDNIKCCMFFFLEIVLLLADRLKLVKKNNFTIIENDNLLEKYPWGNLCYDLTISSLQSKMKMWGFHVIPMVPNMTPLRAFLNVRYPRMLGYQFPNILHYNRLANDVFNKKQYIVNNELIPTEEELQKTYMINFWVRPDDKQYVGPPVVHVSAPSFAVPEPEPEQEPVYTTRASTQSQPEGAHSQHLEGMINELQEDFGMDVVLYFIRKRIDGNFGLFPSNVIIVDCFFWASMQGCYNKHVVRDPHVDEDMEQFEQNIDWASEMNDTPFSEYYEGKRPLGSSSWAHKDIVSINHFIFFNVIVTNFTNFSFFKLV